MVLKIVGAAFNAFFPTQYTVHIVAGIVVILALRAFSRGRTTNRERDLHARKIIVTGGFTPLGLTILQSLAERGAHIIALSPHPIDSPEVSIIVTLLRSTFSNENIYAEQCDLTSPGSIRSFCTRFLTGQDQRIDAIIYAHEYQHIGSARPFSRTQTLEEATNKRESASLSTFFMTTLLLPTLLVAPVERDIRVVHVVNPFYAAATSADLTSAIPFSSRTSSVHTNKRTLFLQEGTRSLRTAILARHLQRILDSLPSAQVPKTEDGSSTVPVVSAKAQRSNIISVSVSPGLSRMDTICPLFNADWTAPSGFSYVGVIFYVLLQPLLRILTKSPNAAMQTVLHALFLPTPFKVHVSSAASKANPSTDDKGKDKLANIDIMPEEILKPGALYAECAVVRLKVPTIPLPDPPVTEKEPKKTRSNEDKGKGKAKGPVQVINIPEDGEFGGEATGRAVWEAYEDALKAWEKADPNPPPPSAPKEVEQEKDAGREEVVDVYG